MAMPILFGAPLRAWVSRCALFAAACLILPVDALAHVTLDGPSGGPTLTGGEIATIQWRPDPPHDTLRWALWYATEELPLKDDAGWIPIDLDIPTGENLPTTVYTYDWTVPNLDDDSVWVRVLQANDTLQDYYDVSAEPFAIAASLNGDYNFDQSVTGADYVSFADFGRNNTLFTAWSDSFGSEASSVLGSTQSVPEPGGLVLVASFAGVAVFGRRRR